jgi:BMFP domain-containing protein YqiC
MPIPKPDSKMLDDLARVAGGAVNVFSGLQEQILNDVRSRVEEVATRLDLVPRDELDKALGMIEKLRQELRALESRIDTLDGKGPAKKSTAPTAGKAKAKAPGRKPSPKHVVKKKK